MKKIIYLAACGMGKSFFKENSSLNVLEIPFANITDAAKVILKYIKLPDNSNAFMSFNSKVIRDLIEVAFSEDPNVVILGPSIISFYRMIFDFLEDFSDYEIITLVPSREQKEEYYWRFKGREDAHPYEREMGAADLQMRSWNGTLDFFEEEAKYYKNIIFTKPGEYVTDYIDINTGEFKRPELLSKD